MSKQDNGDRVWDIIEKVGVCMLTTQAAGRLRARPIEARPDRKAGLIFAVTDVHSAKQDEIEATPQRGPRVHRCEGESLPLDHCRRPRHARYLEDCGRLEKDRRGVVVERIDRSQCMPVADRASDRRGRRDRRPPHTRAGRFPSPVSLAAETGAKRSAAFGPAELSGGISVVPARFSAMHQSDRGVTLSERILTRSYPAKATRS